MKMFPNSITGVMFYLPISWFTAQAVPGTQTRSFRHIRPTVSRNVAQASKVPKTMVIQWRSAFAVFLPDCYDEGDRKLVNDICFDHVTHF